MKYMDAKMEENWKNQRAATFNFKIVIAVIMPRGHCVISVFYPLGRKTHFMDDINGNGRGGGSKRGSMDFIDTLLPSSSRDRKANRRLDSSSR